jgi:lipid-A-disaccharide synthase
MVITYRQSTLSWALQRPMLYLPYVGMPNILAGERLVPELIQARATPAALARALLELLLDPAQQQRQVSRFREMHVALRQNNAATAAAAVLGVLDAGRA